MPDEMKDTSPSNGDTIEELDNAPLKAPDPDKDAYRVRLVSGSGEVQTVWVDDDGFLREFRTNKRLHSKNWEVEDLTFDPWRVSQEKAGAVIGLSGVKAGRHTARIDEHGFVRSAKSDALLESHRWEPTVPLEEVTGPGKDYTLHHTDGTSEEFTSEKAT